MRRILYIEDNQQIRQSVAEILSFEGYEVLQADDGVQGVIMAAEQHPDLILMDLHMKGFDGIRATLCLRSDEKLASIPIIAVSASERAYDGQLMLNMGFDASLPKPFAYDHLLYIVHQFAGDLSM
jgi:CheY-like chemotaxis protein